MSGRSDPRPLVTGATHEAAEQAVQLLPAGVNVESAVTRAITAGRIRISAKDEELGVVPLDGGVVALVRRDRSAMTGRLGWKVFKVTPDRPLRRDTETRANAGCVTEP